MLWGQNCQILMRCSIVLLNYKVVLYSQFCFIFLKCCMKLQHFRTNLLCNDSLDWWRVGSDGEERRVTGRSEDKEGETEQPLCRGCPPTVTVYGIIKSLSLCCFVLFQFWRHLAFLCDWESGFTGRRFVNGVVLWGKGWLKPFLWD